MSSDEEISKSTAALFNAMRDANASKLGGIVVYAEVPLSLSINGELRVDSEVFTVSFIHDKNWPKVYIPNLDDEQFHTEFSVRFQKMSYTKDKTLCIGGKSDRFPKGYLVELFLANVELRRNV